MINFFTEDTFFSMSHVKTWSLLGHARAEERLTPPKPAMARAEAASDLGPIAYQKRRAPQQSQNR